MCRPVSDLEVMRRHVPKQVERGGERAAAE
jgi:hypothetical protein